MISQETIENKNFTLYSVSLQSNTNPLGEREDYIAIGKVGDVEYLILIQYYRTNNEGLTKIRDYWNDPILFPEFYFVGEITTEQELNEALINTGFDSFHTIDFDKIWLYK